MAERVAKSTLCKRTRKIKKHGGNALYLLYGTGWRGAGLFTACDYDDGETFFRCRRRLNYHHSARMIMEYSEILELQYLELYFEVHLHSFRFFVFLSSSFLFIALSTYAG